MYVPTRPRCALASIAVAAMLLAVLPAMPAAALATCPGGSTTWALSGSGAWDVAANWSLGVPDETKDACIDVPGTYTVTATGLGNTAKSITVANPAATLQLSGNSSVGNAVVTVAGGVTNEGLIELTATANGWAGELRLTSGTMVNIGTIRAHVGAGAGSKARVIAAPTIDNSGTIDLDFATRIYVGASGLTNTGSLDIALGVELAVFDLGGSPPTVANTTGTISHAGMWVQFGGLIDLAGGTVDVTGGGFGLMSGDLTLGDVALVGAPGFGLSDADLTLADPAPDAATFRFSGPGNTLTGNIAADQTLRVSGNSSLGDAVVTSATGFTNEGVIELTALANSWAGELRVTSGTLVNSGTIVSHVGADMGTRRRLIAAPTIQNSGVLDLDFTTRVETGFPGLVNTGSIDIAAGVALTVDDLGGTPPTVANTSGAISHAGTWNQLGGLLGLGGTVDATGGGFAMTSGDVVLGTVALSGAPTFTLREVDLTLKDATPDAATFVFTGPGNTLTGAVGAPQTMRLSGNSSVGDAVVTAADGLINEGLIELTAAANSWTGELHVTDGTLVNTGTIHAHVGAQTGNDARVIAAPTIDNSGTLDLDFTTRVQTSGATLANTGVVDIADGVTVDVVGAYAQSAAGRLAVGLSSASNGLLEADSASLGGTIEAVTEPSDLPEDDVEYTVVTAGSRSGEFTTLDGADLGDGRMLHVDHRPTTVVLATQESDPPPVIADDPGEDPNADVSVAVTAPADSLAVGALLDFTLAVSNDGPDAATEVEVTDVLPAGLVFSAGSEGCSADGQAVTCQLGTMPAGASTDLTVTVAGTAAGEATNTATVSTTATDDDPSNDTSSVTVTVSSPEEVTERVFGLSRIETAVSASQSTYADTAAGAVVLARADTFPDALAGAPLAVANQAPLLLTGSEALHPLAAQELERVLAAGGTVHLLGGPGALSDAVADRVEQLGFATVRYPGADRYETAVLIAQGMARPRAIFVATGTNFPDALTSGAAAAEMGGVIVLTRGEQMADATARFLADHPDVPRYAVGGPAAVADPGATPVVGPDRYATALQVATTFFEAPAIVGLAVGSGFPDALAGGTHVARRRAPMLLVGTDTLPEPVRAYLAANRGSIGQVFVYGGGGAVSTDVERAVVTALV